MTAPGVMEMDDGAELVVRRSWGAVVVADPKPKDLTERLVVVRNGKRVSVHRGDAAAPTGSRATTLITCGDDTPSGRG